MLTTGCECPIDAKPENLRAMVETGKSYRGKKGRVKQPDTVKKEVPREVDIKGKIAQALADLQYDDVLKLVDQAIQDGTDPLMILNDCRAGMDRVGERYSTGEYFLSELIMSANIFKKVMDLLEPRLMEGQGDAPLGSVVISTPKGDIHDIGKDIVATLFKAAGFNVFDLGVDVAPELILEKITQTNAKVVAMSALITPTFASIKRVVDLLKEKDMRDGRYVIIGGGPTSAAVRDYVGADAWTLDPKEGINWCRDFVKNQP